MKNALTTVTSTTTRQPIVAIATEKVTGPKLLEAAYGGTVRFAKQRGTGTLRHWPVLAPGSAQRKQAESILEARGKKATVEQIAKSMNVSVPTVRRNITALAFTLELEGLKAAEKSTIAKAAVTNMEALAAEQPEQPKAEAPKADKPKAEKPKAEAPKTETKAQRGKRVAAEKRAEARKTVEAGKKAGAAKAEVAKS